MLMPRFLTLTGMILIAAFSRLVPHPTNVTPITALALFGGAYFLDKRIAFVVPFAALLLSDLSIGFHNQMFTVYFSFGLTILIGFALRRNVRIIRIASATLLSSTLFFLITNFGVWWLDALYPKTLQGLWTCYVAAIPFFRNSLLGDLFYVAVLFGGFALAQKRFPALQISEIWITHLEYQKSNAGGSRSQS